MDAILDRVGASNCHFKSQQIGDPDLTHDEKKQIAREILVKNPSLFLHRFGKPLTETDLKYFEQFRGDYEVNYYLTELGKKFNTEKNRIRIKNRRYEALKELIDKGEYFSDCEMKKRSPLLYEQMIGQFLTDEEREAAEEKIDKSDLRFSSILMSHIERDQVNNLRKMQECEEDGMIEENDSDDEEDDDYLSDKFDMKISDIEKQQLREEFVSNMQHSFLSGKDEDFDYSTVDDNEDYDVCDNTLDEDKYFDSEEPETVPEVDENIDQN